MHASYTPQSMAVDLDVHYKAWLDFQPDRWTDFLNQLATTNSPNQPSSGNMNANKIYLRQDGGALEDGAGIRVPTDALFGKRGAVTQLTSTATTVVLNATNGKITMFAALGAAGGGSEGDAFTFTNAKIQATSQIYLHTQATTVTAAATRKGIVTNVVSMGAGTCVLHIYNADAAATSAAPIIHFHIVNPLDG